jgi:hypothetical protein
MADQIVMTSPQNQNFIVIYRENSRLMGQKRVIGPNHLLRRQTLEAAVLIWI